MDLSARQRRPIPPEFSVVPSRSNESYTKLDKPVRVDSSEEERKKIFWLVPFLALGTLRYMSATSNIIHDCDEVFNYWEPLHYLLYKTGFQTWEYSSQYALRSYLYILIHRLVASPASWFFGDEKVKVFFSVRFFLGLLSAITDTVLVVALSKRYGRRLASYTLAMLCLTSGCFFASTSLLPSSFSMYAMSLSSGLFLLGLMRTSVLASAVGVILGWPFSVLAFLPVTVTCLRRSPKPVLLWGAAASSLLLAASVTVDLYYYGRWTSSLLNLVVYNVVGGGESHLYGTEGAFYYVRNAFNNFNLSFVFALFFLALPLLPSATKRYAPDLFIAVSPIYLWLGFMSLQPHKEERFLYPIYPLLCVASSAVIESFPDFFTDEDDTRSFSFMAVIAKCARPAFLFGILCASHARTFSMIHGYSAPLEIYSLLEHHGDDVGSGGGVLCVGSEWHRYPSSFFVPQFVGGVHWVDDGFRGLLPFPFNSSTSSAPSYFNSKNAASDRQYLRDEGACSFHVELHLRRPHQSRTMNLSEWEVLAALPYLDREFSPAISRSFFVPYLWHSNNNFGLYRLLRRYPKHR